MIFTSILTHDDMCLFKAMEMKYSHSYLQSMLQGLEINSKDNGLPRNKNQ